jgi:CheY-like chemotaxis protein
VVGTAVVLAANNRYSGLYLVENLSAGGALLVGDARTVGEQLKLFLHLPGMKPMSISAEVLRQEGSDAESFVAVTFRNLSKKFECTIREVVLATLESLRAGPEVLIVDDSVGVRRALERDLYALGRYAVSAATPLEAVDWLTDDTRCFDTAIVDLRLGHADGLEFLTFLTDGHPVLRRILMSGNIPFSLLRLAVVSGGANAVLDKPWSRESLARALVR